MAEDTGCRLGWAPGGGEGEGEHSVGIERERERSSTKGYDEAEEPDSSTTLGVHPRSLLDRSVSKRGRFEYPPFPPSRPASSVSSIFSFLSERES